MVLVVLAGECYKLDEEPLYSIYGSEFTQDECLVDESTEDGQRENGIAQGLRGKFLELTQ
jgi:hypothetical protein